jgi:hypothetical protein
MGKRVRGLAEKVPVKAHLRLVWEKCQRVNARLNQILEKVSAIRHLGRAAVGGIGHLDQRACIEDVRIADLDTQLDIRSAPAARPHQYEVLVLQCLVDATYQPPNLQPPVHVGDAVVSVRLDEDHIPHTLNNTLRHLSVCREQPILRRNIVWDAP